MILKSLKKKFLFFREILFIFVVQNILFPVLFMYVPLKAINLTGNTHDAAQCFAAISALAGSDEATVNNALFALGSEDILSAFEQMNQALFSATTNAQLLDAVSIRAAYSKHLQVFTFNKNHLYKEPLSLWTDGLIQFQEQQNSFGYSDTTLGSTIGIDYRIRNGVLGSAFSYTHDTIRPRDSNSKATLNSYYGGLYSYWNYNKFYIDVTLIGAFNHYKTRRLVNFGTINREANAHHNGDEWLIHGGFQYQLSKSRFQWTPYVNLDYVILRERSYTESGAGSLNLHVYQKHATIFQTEAGISFNANYHACKGIFTPTLTLAYVNQSPCSNEDYWANFVDSSCQFNGKAGSYRQNLFAPSLGLTYQGLSDRVNISLYLDNQVGSNYWAQDIAFDVTCRF